MDLLLFSKLIFFQAEVLYSSFIIFINKCRIAVLVAFTFGDETCSMSGGTINSFVGCVAAPVTSECFSPQAFRAVCEHSRGFI